MPDVLMLIESKAAALLLRLLKRTIRFDVRNQSAIGQDRCIYAFWHRDQVFLLLQRAGTKSAILVSSSRDGELIAGPAEELGYTVVRGSSTRGGAKALTSLVRYGKTHFLALTPDGLKDLPARSIPGSIILRCYQDSLLWRLDVIRGRNGCSIPGIYSDFPSLSPVSW